MTDKTLSALRKALSKSKQGNCPVMFHQMVKAADAEIPEALRSVFSEGAIRNIITNKNRHMMDWVQVGNSRTQSVASVLGISMCDMAKVTRFIPDSPCSLTTLTFRRNLFNSGLDIASLRRLSGATPPTLEKYLMRNINTQVYRSVYNLVQNKCYYGLEGSVRGLVELSSINVDRLSGDSEALASLYKEFYEQIKDAVNEHTTSA